MQRGRTLLGMAAAAWLVLAYPLSDGREESILGKLLEVAISCGVLLIGSTVGITAFLLAGTQDRSRHFTRRLLGPLKSVLALAAGPAVFWLSVTTLKGDLVGEPELVAFFPRSLGPGSSVPC